MNKSENSTVDNAASAVASMLLHGAAAAGLPIGDVGSLLLSSLPLEADREESKGVLKALIHLAASYPDFVLQHAEQFMMVRKKKSNHG